MIFVSGLDHPETPRPRADGSWMCVESAAGTVTQISRDGQAVRRVANVGRPNGLCIDGAGTAWVAVTDPVPALVRVEPTGLFEIVLDRYGDLPFLFPNDLCFSERGLLYMTDSGMRMAEWAPGGTVRADWATAQFKGCVCEIDLRQRTARALDEGLRFPNGIAFGADGHLYANEMVTGEIYRYRFSGGRPAGRKEVFTNVLDRDFSGFFRGPDGMAFSADGRLWCAVYGEGQVTVVDSKGALVQRVKTDGIAPTNVAFGLPGERRLYVSEQELGQIEVFNIDAEALPLHAPVLPE